jgi:hypothetical protein
MGKNVQILICKIIGESRYNKGNTPLQGSKGEKVSGQIYLIKEK